MTKFQGQTSSLWCYSISCSKFLILISLFIALCIMQCKSQPFATIGNQTYDDGSKFHNNLITVLGDLVQNTPLTGTFNVSSYGESPNRVYGLLQCRGDASTKECDDCCQNVKEFAASLCSNKTECRLWLDMCEMRYQNYSTSMSSAPTGLVSYGRSKLNSTGYNDNTDLGLRNVLVKSSTDASSTSTRFAKVIVLRSSTINVIVQCFADISNANCSHCLTKAIEHEDNISSTNNYLSSAIYLESCFLILSNETSFNQNNISNYSNQLPTNLGVLGAVIVLITVLLLWL